MVPGKRGLRWSPLQSTGTAITPTSFQGSCPDGEPGRENQPWKGETGFTLVGVLVSAMMMFGVLFALYAIFDVSVRAFGYGGDRLEAVGNTRLALGRMEREIRAAYPYDLTSNPQEIPVSGPHGSHKAGRTYGNPHRVRQRDREDRSIEG